MATLERLEEMLVRLDDKQETFHGEMREHVGQAKQFQARVLERINHAEDEHKSLRTNCEGTSRKVAWIIGVGSAVVFVISVALTALI